MADPADQRYTSPSRPDLGGSTTYQRQRYWQDRLADATKSYLGASPTFKPMFKNEMDSMTSNMQDEMNNRARGTVPSYKHGGIVRKTGLALLHKGERVIPHKKNLLRKKK